MESPSPLPVSAGVTDLTDQTGVPDPASPSAPVRATWLSHVHLKVRDLDRAVTFYTRVFGLAVTEYVGDQYAFLNDGIVHHAVALQGLGSNASAPVAGGVGLYHVAFAVPDAATLARLYVTLTGMGVAVGAVDHRISWALYFDDPDGNGLELFWDTRTAPGGVPLWEGINVPLPADRLLAALSGEMPV